LVFSGKSLAEGCSDGEKVVGIYFCCIKTDKINQVSANEIMKWRESCPLKICKLGQNLDIDGADACFPMIPCSR
jgi:hypothetical protein